MKKSKHGSWLSRQKAGFLTRGVSGRQALKEIKAGQNLQYGETERNVQAALGGSLKRQQDIPGWFQQYQNVLSNSANQTAAAYSQAQQQLSDRMNQAGALDQTNRADMQQRGQADAALRGVAAPTQGANDAANIAASRQNLQASYGGMIGTLGANQAGYLADKSRIGAGEQINQLLKEQTRERGVRSDLRTIAQEKGDYATKYLADLREAERRYALGKATIKGENSRAQLSSSTTRRGQNITAAHNAATESAAIARIRQQQQQGQITAAQANRRIKLEKKRLQESRRHNQASEKNSAKSNKGGGKGGKGGR